MVIAQRMSLEEFARLPEQKPGLEFVDGEVVEKVAPDSHHGVIQMALGFQIGDLADHVVFSEMRFTFGEPPRAYLPDVAIVDLDRIALEADGSMARRQNIAPDVAIEILSPDDRAGHVVDKLNFYMAHGVRLAIVIDDEKKQATVYRPGDQPTSVASPASIDLAPIAPGLAIDLGAIFSRVKPKRRPSRPVS